MKALIIRPREGKSPTFQVVDFPNHDFNEEFGDLYKVLQSDYIGCIRKEHITALFDEECEDKKYTSWWCTFLGQKIKGPVALVSHCDAGNLSCFNNEEVLHSCRESGMEEWPSA